MNTKYILHGGTTTLENDLNKKFFAEIANGLSAGGNVLMCYFAPSVNSGLSEEEKFERGVKLFLKNIPNRGINYVFALRENFIKQLKEVDMLYMHGGGADELFNDLKKYPEFIEELKKKKLVAGSSAGAYVLAKYSIDYADKSEAVERFGVLPIKIFCHFIKEFQDTLVKKFNTVDPKNELELVLLRDCEIKIIIQ